MGYAYDLAKLVYRLVSDEYYAARIYNIDDLRGALAHQNAFTKEVEDLLDEMEDKYRSNPDELTEQIETIRNTHPDLIKAMKGRGGE